MKEWRACSPRRGFDVVGQSGDATGLLECVRSEQPDLAIIDIRMPPTHTTEGLDAASAIRGEVPHTAVVVLSAHVELEQATDLIGSGERSGYLLKSRVTDVDEFIATLDRIVAGGTFVDPTLVQELVSARRVHDPLDALSPRSETCSRSWPKAGRMPASRTNSSFRKERSRNTSAASS